MFGQEQLGVRTLPASLVNAKLVSLPEAVKAYADFGSGEAAKYVITTHGWQAVEDHVKAFLSAA
jgi:hypothetical protein